jgi:hypothetical protein
MWGTNFVLGPCPESAHSRPKSSPTSGTPLSATCSSKCTRGCRAACACHPCASWEPHHPDAYPPFSLRRCGCQPTPGAPHSLSCRPDPSPCPPSLSRSPWSSSELDIAMADATMPRSSLPSSAPPAKQCSPMCAHKPVLSSPPLRLRCWPPLPRPSSS